jgi:hypothetical protein
MKWFDRWFYKQAKKAWDNKDNYEEDIYVNKVKAQRGLQLGTAMAIEKGAVEGEGTIRFELSSAVGGKILTVRRNDPRRDSYEQQTYVIPTGEDLGERVAKIINLEQYKG